MRSFLIVTEVFRALVLAQAKARGVTPRLLVVSHPVGGLIPSELESRIDQAATAFQAAMASE